MKQKIKTILYALLVAAVMANSGLFLTACSSSDYAYLTKKGTLVCGITLYEPMNYLDDEGNLIGFETEFALKVADKLGLEAKFQLIVWESKILELNSKSIDCIWNGFTVNEERRQQVDFSKSYLNNSQCVVVKSANLNEYTSVDSCAEKNGVAEAGSAGENALLTLSQNYIAQNSQTSALTEVLSGTADFAVVDVILANSVVGKGDYSSLRIVDAINLGSEEYAVGFRKGSDVTQLVNKAINELIEEGTLITLAEKYGVENALIRD